MRIDVKGVIVGNDDKPIYEWLGYEATSPNDIISALNKASGQAVDVYIDSGGGDVFAGSNIYTSLRGYKGEVNIHIVGLAASAASVIAMAGKSDISPTAMLMVHNVSSVAGGDYHDMDKMSEVLQSANKSIAAAYVAKTGMSEEEALAMMDHETWLSAQQAVDKGLIDGVMFENYQIAASYGGGLLPKSVIDKIRNTIKTPQVENDEADFFMAKSKLKLLNLRSVNK